MNVTVVMGTCLTSAFSMNTTGSAIVRRWGTWARKGSPPGVATSVRVPWQSLVALSVPQPSPRKTPSPHNSGAGYRIAFLSDAVEAAHHIVESSAVNSVVPEQASNPPLAMACLRAACVVQTHELANTSGGAARLAPSTAGQVDPNLQNDASKGHSHVRQLDDLISVPRHDPNPGQPGRLLRLQMVFDATQTTAKSTHRLPNESARQPRGYLAFSNQMARVVYVPPETIAEITTIRINFS